jgi:hypothetical protein
MTSPPFHQTEPCGKGTSMNSFLNVPRKHRVLGFVSESTMLRIPFAHLITAPLFAPQALVGVDAGGAPGGVVA